MSKTTAGWEQLNCSFFKSICRQILSNYLTSQGFKEQKITPVGGLVYTRDGVFLEISYEPETSPNYSPTLVIGFNQSKYSSTGEVTAVPFWFLIPNDRDERKYSSWTFRTENDLIAVLQKIKTEIVELYAKPLWLNKTLLLQAIEKFRNTIS